MGDEIIQSIPKMSENTPEFIAAQLEKNGPLSSFSQEEIREKFTDDQLERIAEDQKISPEKEKIQATTSAQISWMKALADDFGEDPDEISFIRGEGSLKIANDSFSTHRAEWIPASFIRLADEFSEDPAEFKAFMEENLADFQANFKEATKNSMSGLLEEKGFPPEEISEKFS